MIKDIFCFIGIALLAPIAPFLEDRIAVYNQYKASLTIIELQLQQRDPNSYLTRLSRAAVRQKRMNLILIPEFNEMQKNKWNRKSAYAFTFRFIAFWLSLMYGTQCLDPILHQHVPFVAAIVDIGANAVNHFFNSLPRPPRTY